MNIRGILLAILLISLSTVAARADHRVAFVVGNGALELFSHRVRCLMYSTTHSRGLTLPGFGVLDLITPQSPWMWLS